jgi:nicotinamidase-related amidase
MADVITKGSNPWTEHFSGVQAEVPDPDDPSTQVNVGLVRTLEEADVVLMAGEALSHCLANTVRDIAAQFSDPRYVAKIHLLRDATGNVPGFEALGEAFVRELTARGMKLTTTTEFLAAA